MNDTSTDEASMAATETSARPTSRWRTSAVPAAALALVVSAGIAACGGDDNSAYATLPPIITTTTAVPTTAVGAGITQYYIVKPGDSLAKIARAFKVPVDKLRELNAAVLPNPNSLYVGTQLEIPPNVVVVDTLPPLGSSVP